MILVGDSRETLKGLADSSVDSCVCDPPYELGFMGKTWDSTGIAYDVGLWREVLRVLKPGGHLLAFGGTRTHHRMVCAIEDAGFEIRDEIQWLYGSGFPKSLDVSKAIDKAAGAERERGAARGKIGTNKTRVEQGYRPNEVAQSYDSGPPITAAAKQWDGWGTALKPACEPICVARKPLCGTVAANVLAHGTGAINVDGCRVEFQGDTDKDSAKPQGRATTKEHGAAAATPDAGRGIGRIEFPIKQHDQGRWPANVIHDGSEEVLAAFAVAGERTSGVETQPRGSGGIWSGVSNTPCGPQYGDTGTAARFFKECKYSEDELLFCYAKAILERCNPYLANTADNLSFLPSQFAASALSDAAILASQGRLGLSELKELSTRVTPSELRTQSESLITAILSIEKNALHAQPQEKLIQNGCLVKFAETCAQTGTTTITISLSKSDGFADPVTFSITPRSLEAGVQDFQGSRFQYTAKASRSEREHFNTHATVKPLALMRYLVRLVTPPGGTVLDWCAGSGTTLVAARQEGFKFIGCELDEAHADIIRRRLELELPFA